MLLIRDDLVYSISIIKNEFQLIVGLTVSRNTKAPTHAK